MSYENRSPRSGDRSPQTRPADDRHPPRIAPAPAGVDPAVEAELARWMPPGSPIEPLKLFRTLVRNLPLAEAMRPLGSHLLSRRSTLTRRTREIAIDRTCARLGCEYEWGVHATVFGDAAGLDDTALRATVLGDTDDPAWTSDDAPVIALVDALVDTATVPADAWSALAARFSPDQILELIVLVGWYHAIAFLLNAVCVEREEWAARFPVNQ